MECRYYSRRIRAAGAKWRASWGENGRRFKSGVKYVGLKNRLETKSKESKLRLITEVLFELIRRESMAWPGGDVWKSYKTCLAILLGRYYDGDWMGVWDEENIMAYFDERPGNTMECWNAREWSEIIYVPVLRYMIQDDSNC